MTREEASEKILEIIRDSGFSIVLSVMDEKGATQGVYVNDLKPRIVVANTEGLLQHTMEALEEKYPGIIAMTMAEHLLEMKETIGKGSLSSKQKEGTPL